MSGYDCWNKWVFSFRQNVLSDGADWTSTGRLFQSRGPAAANYSCHDLHSWLSRQIFQFFVVIIIVAVARVDVNSWVTSVDQMQKIMYNNYREPKGSFTHSLRDTGIHLAATLHPVKNASFHYRLHKYFLMHDSLRHLRTRLSELQRQLNDVSDELKVIVTSGMMNVTIVDMKSLPDVREFHWATCRASGQWDLLSPVNKSIPQKLSNPPFLCRFAGEIKSDIIDYALVTHD